MNARTDATHARFRDTLGATPGWTLDTTGPRLVSARGHVQRLAHSRAMAVDVIGTVVRALTRVTTPGDLATIHAMSLAEFFRQLLRATVGTTDADEGVALAALLDMLIWGLEWRDVRGEVGRG